MKFALIPTKAYIIFLMINRHFIPNIILKTL